MEKETTSVGSVSLVRQGEHTFYSLTLLTDDLADTCYVRNRDEDPEEGFQRVLDEKRAKEIAAYIDSGLGTIPSSIVLSAQETSELRYDSKKKGLTFKKDPKAFLIIDGQHRVYGFKKAKKAFRTPVIIYSGLSKRDETRLFIDINSKQKGVPPELLLDIKKLAEYENNQEQFLREIFDMFLREQSSALYGKLSPASKSKGKLTRSTFNVSLKPLVKLFGGKSEEEIYQILNNYYTAFNEAVLVPHNAQELMFNTNCFKAISSFFIVVAPKVKDRFGAIYETDNFYHYLELVGINIKPSKLMNPGAAYKPLAKAFEDCLKEEFEL